MYGFYERWEASHPLPCERKDLLDSKKICLTQEKTLAVLEKTLTASEKTLTVSPLKHSSKNLFGDSLRELSLGFAHPSVRMLQKGTSLKRITNLKKVYKAKKGYKSKKSYKSKKGHFRQVALPRGVAKKIFDFI